MEPSRRQAVISLASLGDGVDDPPPVNLMRRDSGAILVSACHANLASQGGHGGSGMPAMDLASTVMPGVRAW